jgi:hypothetical protein
MGRECGDDAAVDRYDGNLDVFQVEVDTAKVWLVTSLSLILDGQINLSPRQNGDLL